MNNLIIIRKPSGVGKSTIGRMFAEKLGKGTAYINVDFFSHDMMIDWLNTSMDERLKFMYENSKFVILNFLKNGYNVVTDGLYCIETDMSLLNNIIKIGNDQNANVYVIELNAKIETIKNRIKIRDRKEDLDFSIVQKRFDIY